MTALAALLGTLVRLEPGTAAVIAAVLHGRPDLADDLRRVCERESRCQPIGVHEIDAHLSRGGWRGQVALGHLTAACQPASAGETRPGARDGWATRGAWGLSAASHWEYLPDCYPPQILDVPIVSAWIAVQKLERCEVERSGWCPRSSSGTSRSR